jgi:hypothetical protein
LGISGRDIGHNRVPDPPDNITGMIVLAVMHPPIFYAIGARKDCAKRSQE